MFPRITDALAQLIQPIKRPDSGNAAHNQKEHSAGNPQHPPTEQKDENPPEEQPATAEIVPLKPQIWGNLLLGFTIQLTGISKRTISAYQKVRHGGKSKIRKGIVIDKVA